MALKFYFRVPERYVRGFRVRMHLQDLSNDDFRLAKRISGLLRGYEHKDLQPHHRHIPPDFDADLYLNFEGMYAFLKKRFRYIFRYTLSREDLYLILKTQDRFVCTIEAGKAGQYSTMNMPYKILQVKAIQGHDQGLIDEVGTYPLVKSIISMDPDYDLDDMKLGFLPRIPCFPHLEEKPVAEEFRILYHYTSWASLQAIICCGIFPEPLLARATST